MPTTFRVMKPKPSRSMQRVREVAERLDKNYRTIRAWEREGCDLRSEDSIQEWALRKRRNSVGKARNNVRANDGMPAVHLPVKLPSPTDEGAAAALKRLQSLEPIFFDRQKKALKTGKSDLISFALGDYQRVCESLRRYEREVEEAARDLGFLIPKAEAQEGARAAAIWFRLAWRLWLSSSIPDLLALADDPRAFKAKAETTFSEVLGVALRNAEGAKCSIPVWARGLIIEEFHADWPGQMG
jgi:hypothetical protein